MNRSVMNRQMFAKGGAAFPDLSGDGQVTQRDILMGRGVQFKEQGGPAMPMTREELYGVPQETRQQQLRLRENIMDRGMIPEGLRNIGRTFGLDIESPEGYQRAKEVEYQLMRERELRENDPAMTEKDIPLTRFVPERRGFEPSFSATPMTDFITRQIDKAYPEGVPTGSPMYFIRNRLGPTEEDVRMQEGGMVPPMDPAMMAPPMDPAMMAPPMDPAMQEGIAGQLDPAIVEPLLAEAATRFGSIDEASGYEDLINRVRGDAAPLEARRDELSMFVGESDAAQTPDSVLAMVQPVIQMSGVDQGIGGLAQQAMDVPVEGPMAEGIMSMAAAPEPMPAEMPMGMDQGMGGPAPVNFNQGGAVRRGDDEPVQYYREAGAVMTPEQETSLAQIFSAGAQQGAQQGYQYAMSQLPEVPSIENAFGPRQETYRGLLGGGEEQKNLTQAQMLFDIANLGLGFAGGAGAARPGMSPAEQLAASAVKLQTLPTISQRAGAQLEQQQKVDLAALQATEKDIDTARSARAKIQEALIKQQTDIREAQIRAQEDKAVTLLQIQDKNNNVIDVVDMRTAKGQARNEELMKILGRGNYFPYDISSPDTGSSATKQTMYRYTGPANTVTVAGEYLIPGETYPLSNSQVENLKTSERGNLRRVSSTEIPNMVVIELDPDSPLSGELGGNAYSIQAQQNFDGSITVADPNTGRFTREVTNTMVNAPGGENLVNIISSDQASRNKQDARDTNRGRVLASISNTVATGGPVPSQTIIREATGNQINLINFDKLSKNLQEGQSQKEAVKNAGIIGKGAPYKGAQYYDIAKAVELNTGLWPNIGRSLTNFALATSPVDLGIYMKQAGFNRAQASAWLETLQVLSAGGLANSSRMPVNDINSKQNLFAPFNAFFQSKQQAESRLKTIKTRLVEELDYLGAQYSEGSLTADQRSAYSNKARNLVLALRMLETVPMLEDQASSSGNKLGGGV